MFCLFLYIFGLLGLDGFLRISELLSIKIENITILDSHINDKDKYPACTLLDRTTILLDINCYTNAKCGQKVLFRERSKSAYFRSSS